MGFKGTLDLVYKTGFVEPPLFSDSQLLQAVMLEVVAQGGSDVYFQTGCPVLVKIHGDLKRLTDRKLTTEECLHIVNWAAGTEQASGAIAQGKESASSYNAVHPTERDATGEKKRFRFRSNAIGGEYRGTLGVQVVMRAIRSEPPTVDEVALEPEILAAIAPDSGVVYISGATGSGKSTTFAAATRYILEGDTAIKGNIVTIEKPIEYLFETVSSAHSVVFQSEIGRGIETFAQGVVSFMRHDPSLIIVGETRDEETGSAVMASANTGHPVFTTVHANDVPSLFSRMLSFYDPSVRDSMLFQVVDSARLLVSQRLVPAREGGRVALREYLVLAPELREEIINTSDPKRITGSMRTMLVRHGRTMAQAAAQAYENGLITEQVMKANRGV